MLVLKIISTVFVGISCITTVLKNLIIVHDNEVNTVGFILATLYSLLWRALVIVTIWVV